MKKMVNWGSPKEYQPGYKDFVRNYPAKKKWPCKRLKGEHKYGPWKERLFNGHHAGWWDKFCVGCGHGEYWLAPEKPGKYYERDITVMPPGYEEEK